MTFASRSNIISGSQVLPSFTREPFTPSRGIVQLCLDFDRTPPTDLRLRERLLALGLAAVPQVVTHRNRTVMVSWLPGRELRIHEGYAQAPDQILAAIVRFLSPRTRRDQRLAARREFLSFSAEDTPRRRPRPGQEARPGRQPLVEYLTQLHASLNLQYFEGRLSSIPIRISRRMKRRLGEVRLTAAPAQRWRLH